MANLELIKQLINEKLGDTKYSRNSRNRMDEGNTDKINVDIYSDNDFNLNEAKEHYFITNSITNGGAYVRNKKIVGFADSKDFKNVTIFKNKKDAQAIADAYEKDAKMGTYVQTIYVE